MNLHPHIDPAAIRYVGAPAPSMAVKVFDTEMGDDYHDEGITLYDVDPDVMAWCEANLTSYYVFTVVEREVGSVDPNVWETCTVHFDYIGFIEERDFMLFKLFWS